MKTNDLYRDALYRLYDIYDGDEENNRLNTKEVNAAWNTICDALISPLAGDDSEKAEFLQCLVEDLLQERSRAAFNLGYNVALELITGQRRMA